MASGAWANLKNFRAVARPEHPPTDIPRNATGRGGSSLASPTFGNVALARLASYMQRRSDKVKLATLKEDTVQTETLDATGTQRLLRPQARLHAAGQSISISLMGTF